MRKSIAIAAILLAACGGGQEQQMPPPDVNAAPVVKKSVTTWDEYSGHVEAIQWAEIRPRVAGHLSGIHYKEGSIVEKGQLLFTIDSREYKAAADAAIADATRAEARVALAKQELKRAEELVKRYRVQATPTVIVNGKYSTGGQMAGSYDAWFAIIDDLAAREHAAASATASAQ